MLLIPLKLAPRDGSDASVWFNPSTADCTEEEYSCSFWITTIMLLPLVPFEDDEEEEEEENCVSMMFCATCDSALVGPPKFEPAMLYETAPKNVGICVPNPSRAMIHATTTSL